jgi:cytochrome P450
MFSIGHQILARSKAAIRADGEKDFGAKRDLLSILLKANMSGDVPTNQRLNDEELVSRRRNIARSHIEISDVLTEIPTFLVGGHETTRSDFRSIF